MVSFMASPRSLQIDARRPGWIHCISRCVRRAYLAGDGWAHRQGWVEDRLHALAGVFAVEVAAYAVMSNHVHLVLRLDPEVVAAWSDAAVVARWTTVFGKRLPREVNGQILPNKK